VTDPEEKKLVLVVDDAPANLQVVNSILKDDFKIRVATSGAKALELVKVKPHPDLILLDVMMPEMDGYEVCGILKASPETKDIPVIFLTGKTEADDETKGFQVGAVDYIHKPFSPSVVKARVHTHLVLREAREQLARQLLTINNELEMAREIQLSILPHEIPKIRGLGIAARYLPMNSVAGDFYDFILVDEKRVGILIADVSGHGLPAALIASMLKVALSAQSAHACDPARVLNGLNHSLCGKFKYHFVTAAYVFVDMEKQTMSYAAAGHPPLLLWQTATASASEVVQNGLLLGMFPQETYSAVKIAVQPGDKAILYTDGILETSSPSDEDFGIELFKGFLESKHHLKADAFADLLLDELAGWSKHAIGFHQQDDITLLAIDFQIP
jgi:sigma-B regulation protein RsbU (phosphoserine phosphatase)